jgi:hypothetical protein
MNIFGLAFPDPASISILNVVLYLTDNFIAMRAFPDPSCFNLNVIGTYYVFFKHVEYTGTVVCTH